VYTITPLKNDAFKNDALFKIRRLFTIQQPGEWGGGKEAGDFTGWNRESLELDGWPRPGRAYCPCRLTGELFSGSVLKDKNTVFQWREAHLGLIPASVKVPRVPWHLPGCLVRTAWPFLVHFLFRLVDSKGGGRGAESTVVHTVPSAVLGQRVGK
jgi:hypothetical protein